MSATTVIVGASVAGVRTAQALRSEGYAGDVVLVGAEPDLPYDKPPLSKALLAGTASASDALLLRRPEAAAAGIQLLLGRPARRLDIAAGRLELASGESIRFDDLVVATGARARPSPWGSRPGVHVLRTLPDAQALREDLLRGGPLVVIGGGFIGAEVASTARGLGLEVTVVDPLPVPVSRLLGAEIGEFFVDLHERHGVRTRFGVAVAAIDGPPGALRVSLTSGEVLTASTVVVGIGAQPNDEWLRPSGLLIEDGVVCDAYCRAVDARQVYAVGDVCRWYHPRHQARVRVEHWTNAVEQAGCVAHNIAHPDDPRTYAPVEYVWSDQFDWKIQMTGRPASATRHSLVGDPQADRFAALYADDGGRLIGAVTVNWPRALFECRRALGVGADLADVRGKLASRLPVERHPLAAGG